MTRPARVRAWFGLLAALVLLAVVGQLIEVVRHDGSVVNFFSYFTVQSNLLVLLTCGLLLADPDGRRTGPGLRSVRLAGLTGITVTGVVYGSLIAPYTDPHGAEWLYDVLFHYVSPVMAVVGFFWLGPRGGLGRQQLWWCILWPVAWLAYTLIRAEAGDPRFAGLGLARSRYPYGFLDVDVHGWGVVVPTIVGVAALLVALAAAYIGLDRHLTARLDISNLTRS